MAKDVRNMDEGIRTKIAVGFYVDGKSIKTISENFEMKQASLYF